MSTENSVAFFRFANCCRASLKRISQHTRGEHDVDDVQAEAWLMAQAFAADGDRLDLDDPADAERLLSHLYQHLVRYTDLTVRHAVRLDHSPAGHEGDAHPLSYLLAAGPHYDPAEALMLAQEAAVSLPTAHQSLAGAYLALLERFGNRIADVAGHLLISPSYCYRRCAHARRLAAQQHPLPPESAAGDPAFIPGAWRRFRVVREPRQLAFDFEWAEVLFEATAAE